MKIKMKMKMRMSECPDESESRMNDGREKRGMKPNRPPRPVSGSYNGELDSSDIWSNVFF